MQVPAMSCAKSLALAALSLMLSSSLTYADAREDAKAQVAFGITVAQNGLWREAIYRFERATEIDPAYTAAFNNLAVAYEQEGLPDKARAAYEKALELDPENTLIRQNYDLFVEVHGHAKQPAKQPDDR